MFYENPSKEPEIGKDILIELLDCSVHEGEYVMVNLPQYQQDRTISTYPFEGNVYEGRFHIYKNHKWLKHTQIAGWQYISRAKEEYHD